MNDKDLEIYELFNNQNTRNKAIELAIESLESSFLPIIYRYYPNINVSHIDDCLQECRIAVMSALATFNPSKGSFSTWCRLPIKHAIIAYIDRNINNDSTYNLKKFGKTNFVEYRYDYECSDNSTVDDAIEQITLRETLVKALNKLTDRQRYVIIRCYGLGNFNRQKPCEIARELGISVSSLADSRRRAERKIKKYLIKE